MAVPVSDWRPYTSRVQGGLRDGNFVNGQFILLCAGPPYYQQVSQQQNSPAFEVFPIGLTQNFSLSQNKSVSRVFEIGSDRSYFIPGRSVGQLTLGRVMYHGPSLLRAMYATFSSTTGAVKVPPLTETLGIDPLQNDVVYTEQNAAAGSKNLHSVQVPPGYDNMFLNLASDMFNNPTGLLMLMKDSEERTLAGAYFENCYIPTHSLAVDSQGLIMQESIAIQYERMQPLSLTPRIKLVQGVITDQFSMKSSPG